MLSTCQLQGQLARWRTQPEITDRAESALPPAIPICKTPGLLRIEPAQLCKIEHGIDPNDE